MIEKSFVNGVLVIAKVVFGARGSSVKAWERKLSRDLDSGEVVQWAEALIDPFRPSEVRSGWIPAPHLTAEFERETA